MTDTDIDVESKKTITVPKPSLSCNLIGLGDIGTLRMFTIIHTYYFLIYIYTFNTQFGFCVEFVHMQYFTQQRSIKNS